MTEQTDTEQTTSLSDKIAELRAKIRSGEIKVSDIKRPTQVGTCAKGEDCEICGGSGYYRIPHELGHPDFGKIEQCPNVSVWRLAGAEHYGLFEDEIEYLSWDSIQIIHDSSALEAGQMVRGVLDQGHGWVYLFGTHGQAKTLILKIAVAMALKENKMAAYANMADVISHLQQAFDQDNPSIESQKRLDWWSNLPILCLDEFNRFNKTKWAETSQFRLMDSRNVQAIRQKSVTIIASNQSPDELDPYYRSRIMDGRYITISLNGRDARPEMRQGDLF